ncbi:MAG TPA: transglycosylase SLT domain-containing protein [Candidatus Aquilonibacter sp.]|nr:transglycosylase SLT domain-containing protein [Candidatus Aquilonibacter sp.]
MPPKDLLELARTCASEFGLDQPLVCALIEEESSWNPFAIRYEPEFRVRYVTKLNLPPTEEFARSFSWGLMQVMGQVAREHGFEGSSLAELCTPDVGLKFGCITLIGKLRVAGGDLLAGLALWNGGGNPDYPRKILSKLQKYR